MGQIYDYLNGIDNAIQNLHIKATDENVTIIKAILNTIKMLQREMGEIDKKIKQLEAASASSVDAQKNEYGSNDGVNENV